jgi:hypothetical protein
VFCESGTDFLAIKNKAFKKNETALSYIQKSVYLIDTQIYFIEKQTAPQNIQQSTILQWQGTTMEFVELVYALHEAGCFGDVSLKNVFQSVGKAFGCEVTNYYRLFWDIKNRSAEERAFFLKKLIRALSDKLLRMDSGSKL